MVLENRNFGKITPSLGVKKSWGQFWTADVKVLGKLRNEKNKSVSLEKKPYIYMVSWFVLIFGLFILLNLNSTIGIFLQYHL